MPYTVTRQLQWPEGRPVVELSVGELDYANPDVLGFSFPGELVTYDDPREAAENAIRVCEAWRAAGQSDAQVARGATGGMTMPFDPCSYEELRTWADTRYQALPKCDGCGQLLPARHYTHLGLRDEGFCSEACAERAYADLLDSEPVEFQVCEACLAAAEEIGVAGRARQAALMAHAGEDVEDHACEALDNPAVRCECACQGTRAASRTQPALRPGKGRARRPGAAARRQP